MTDKQKIEALTKLLDKCIHALDEKRYVIEDVGESYQCEDEAAKFYQQMINILHSKS